MTELAALPQIRSFPLDATVTRCGCGNPLSHASLGLPCPRPRRIENRGRIAYRHRNPVRVLAWRLARWPVDLYWRIRDALYMKRHAP